MTQAPPKTWDGKPVSKEKPYGASVVVFRISGKEIELLMLHRGHLGKAFEGPWAWTPPSGARHPGEPIDSCAERELLEEAGLALPIRQAPVGTEEWFVYVAQAPSDAVISLDSEHDRFGWMPVQKAVERCQPEVPHQLLIAAAKFIVVGLSKG